MFPCFASSDFPCLLSDHKATGPGAIYCCRHLSVSDPPEELSAGPRLSWGPKFASLLQWEDLIPFPAFPIFRGTVGKKSLCSDFAESLTDWFCLTLLQVFVASAVFLVLRSPELGSTRGSYGNLLTVVCSMLNVPCTALLLYEGVIVAEFFLCCAIPLTSHSPAIVRHWESLLIRCGYMEVHSILFCLQFLWFPALHMTYFLCLVAMLEW